MRFTLRFLLGLTAACASCFAILAAEQGWTRFIFNLLLLSLCIVTVFAFLAKPSRRPFWIGFSVFAWATFLMWFVPASRDLLYTSGAARWLQLKVVGDQMFVDATVWNNQYVGRLEVHGHFASVIVLGLAGGLLGLLVDRLNKRGVALSKT